MEGPGNERGGIFGQPRLAGSTPGGGDLRDVLGIYGAYLWLIMGRWWENLRVKQPIILDE